MTNPLTDLFGPAVRRYLYAAYTLAGLVAGALAISGVNIGKTTDVLAYLGAALGLTAASNVASPSPDYYDPDASGLPSEAQVAAAAQAHLDAQADDSI